MAQNFEKAAADGAPGILTKMDGVSNADRNRRAAQAHAPRPRQFGTNATWEEFPFASTYEGGQGATLTLAPGRMNSKHGRALQLFYKLSGLKDGMPFMVRVK